MGQEQTDLTLANSSMEPPPHPHLLVSWLSGGKTFIEGSPSEHCISKGG